MAATSTTETWDAAWTLAMRAHKKRLTDNIFDEYPTLQMLKEAGNLETETGGKEIKEDLMYGKNSGNQWFSDYDTLNTDAVDGITAAFYPWRYQAVPITISMTEEMESRKSDAAVKLLTAKTQQSMNSIRDSITAAIYGAQSGKSMLGLQDIVADSAGSTLGGINSSSETWWENQRNTTSTDFNSSSAPSYAGVLVMSEVYNNASEGNDHVTDIYTNLTLFSELQNILEGTGYARLTSDRSPFTGSDPAFRGAVVKYDRDCSSQHMYFLNRKYLKLKMQSGMNFAKTPFKEPTNQLAKVAFIVVGLQLTTNNRRRHGVATTLT